MRGINLSSALVVVLLVLFSFGCSNDTGVAPVGAENDIDLTTLGGKNDLPSGPLHVYGNVFYKDGTYAVGVRVRIDWHTDSVWSGPVYVTTGQYGDFSYDIIESLDKDDQVRCASLNDVATRIYNGISSYMYFSLTERMNDTKWPDYMDPGSPEDGLP